MKRCSTARSGARVSVQILEARLLLAAAFDQTGLTDLRVDPAFIGVDGSDVGVAVLDTGIYGLHPQLRPNVLAYYNAVTTPIPGSIDVTSVQVSADRVGHGSHVAGTVGSTNAQIGVAPAAKIVAVKVLPDAGEAQIGGDPLLRGLQFVRQYANQFNIKVVNMSLGEISFTTGGINVNSVPNPDALSRAVDDLEAMGITVVAASGNSYANDPVPGASIPAVYSTISVASTWSDTGLGHDFGGIGLGSPFDSYGPFESSAQPDRFAASSQRSTLPNQVAAPGVDIFSTWNGEPGLGGARLFNTISGTSMASPFISGVVALMQDAAMTFGGRYLSNPAQILDIIKTTADSVTDSNVADNGRYQIVNGQLIPTPLPLPETGEDFVRVNVLNAVRRVRTIMVGNTPGGDTDATAANSTQLPALTTGASIIRRGRIGADGSIQIGPNDVDLFRVTVAARGDLSILLTQPAGGQAFAPSVRLFDAGGIEIGQSDGLLGIYPSLRSDPAAPLNPGVYYVGVSSMANFNYSIANGSGIANGQSEGDYALTIAVNSPDVDGVATGARPVDLTLPDTLAFASEVSVVRPGIIGADDPTASNPAPNLVPSGDVDMYTFVAPDTGNIQARTLSRTVPGGAFVDTYIRIFDRNLVELGFNDNQSPGNPDSLVSVPVTTGETYYVGVTNTVNKTFSASDPFGRIPGSTPNQEEYSLYLKFSSGDVDGTAVSAAARTLGTPVAGAVGSDGGTVTGADGGEKDVDFSVFSAPAAGLLDLAVTGAGGLETALALWEYNSAQHTIVKLGESQGAAPRLIRQVSPGQVLYASVTGRGNEDFNWFAVASGPGGQTGTYTLNSTLRPLSDLPSLNDGSVQAATPGTVGVGAPVIGTLGMDASLLVDADVDVYRFAPGASGRYDIRTDTTSEGSADTILRVFDAAGNPLALNDDATGVTNSSALRVTLVGGQTYYLGVSGGGAATTYDVNSGAGSTPGSRGAYALSVNPTAAGAPAVSIADAAPTAESFRGGSAASFNITLDAPSAGPVTVFYTTADGTAAAGADYAPTSGTVTFAPGETVKTITVPVIGDAAAEGEEAFAVNVAVVSGADAMVADGQGLAPVVNQVVQSVGFNAALKATFTDADGGRVVVSLKGPGSGELLLLGGGAADAAGITLSGTTPASVLTIAGDTSIGDITVNGSLKGLAGKALDLVGNLAVAGSLSQLKLRNVSGHSISTGPGVLNAVLGAVVDGSITTFGAIKSVKVAQWVDNDGVGDVLSAASIGSIASRGNFGADVTTGSIGKLTVGGNLIGSDVRVGGKIGAVKLGAASGSRVFAGVGSSVATLPDGMDDFVNPDASITSFAITGRAGTFSSSMVAAPSIGKVLLGAVETNNGGTPFGVAADSIKSLATNLLRLKNLQQPGDSQTDADFNVRVL